MRIKALASVLMLLLLLSACNMPAGQAPVTAPSEVAPVSLDADAMATAVELTAVARVTEIAGSAVPAAATVTTTPLVTTTPTVTLTSAPVVSGPCNPTVTATVVANVRSGPDTAYDIVGSLSLGQTATIVGRNDAYTWWYIDYPGVAGNHAWIAGSVVTSACVPSVVQVVAAPPLPITPTEVVAASDDEDDGNGPLVLQPVPGLQLALKKPDLIVSEFAITPATPVMGQNVQVRIGAYNDGNAVSGQFTVHWYGLSSFPNPSCSWTVDSLVAHGGRILKCNNFAFNSWYPINKTSVVIVDVNNQVSESNEGNNKGTISPFGVTEH